MDPTQELQKRIEALEAKTRGIQPTALLNQNSFDPASATFFQDLLAIPYDTSVPTFVPRKYGVTRVIKTGGNYYLYVYLDSAWKRTQLT